jgi:signal transduction histidine kinase
LKFRTKLIISFLILSGITGVSGILAIAELSFIDNSTKQIPLEIQEITTSSKLDSHAQSIRYYDEVLTQSARNYAFTEDKKWEERYKEFEPLLDNEINQALLIGDKSLSDLFNKVDTANKKLVELEYQSMELVNQGNAQQAIIILQSKEYQNNKIIYEDALRKYVKIKGLEYNDVLFTSTEKIEDSINVVSDNIFVGLNLFYIFIPFMVIISILISIIISKSITNPIQKLEEFSKKISKGDFSKQIEITGSDEIKNLSKSFNEMAIDLKKIIELEKELTVTNEKIKREKFTAIGELSARIAHDIRNPLSIIRNTFDTMEYIKDEPEKYAKSIDRINRAIDRITHQLNDVMDFVRTNPMKIEETSLKNMLDMCIENISVPDNIKISYAINESKIFVDYNQFEVVLTNLILNSIQSIRDKDGKISIKSTSNQKNIEIEITDTGPDIPDEVVDKIFDPLFTTKQEGTGLGLAGCRTIIEQHGGIIFAKNNPKIFTISIPKIN